MMGKSLHDILATEFPATNITVTVSEDGCYNIDYWARGNFNPAIELIIKKIHPQIFTYSIQQHWKGKL